MWLLITRIMKTFSSLSKECFNFVSKDRNFYSKSVSEESKAAKSKVLWSSSRNGMSNDSQDIKYFVRVSTAAALLIT